MLVILDSFKIVRTFMDLVWFSDLYSYIRKVGPFRSWDPDSFLVTLIILKGIWWSFSITPLFLIEKLLTKDTWSIRRDVIRLEVKCLFFWPLVFPVHRTNFNLGWSFTFLVVNSVTITEVSDVRRTMGFESILCSGHRQDLLLLGEEV